MPTRSFIAFLFSLSFAMVAARADDLTIGSPAPPINIEHWFHAKEPIPAFENGKVYVVEFWATWCGPCIASMPHLAEIQRRHSDDLTVISVSDEEPEKVEKFLDREKDDTTFREITKGYWLATDPDGSVRQDYMRGAGESGIPTAFIVGKTGQIEWIGHPMRLDEPVAKIIAGDWDREAYAAERAEEKRVRGQMGQISRLIKQNKFDDAIARLDELIAEVKNDRIRAGLEQGRQRLQAQATTFAENQQRKNEQSASLAKAHAETVARLLDVAFHVQAGKTEEATATLDRLIESAKDAEVKQLLEQAREKLTEEWYLRLK